MCPRPMGQDRILRQRRLRLPQQRRTWCDGKLKLRSREAQPGAGRRADLRRAGLPDDRRRGDDVPVGQARRAGPRAGQGPQRARERTPGRLLDLERSFNPTQRSLRRGGVASPASLQFRTRHAGGRCPGRQAPDVASQFPNHRTPMQWRLHRRARRRCRLENPSAVRAQHLLSRLPKGLISSVQSSKGCP